MFSIDEIERIMDETKEAAEFQEVSSRTTLFATRF